MTMQYALGVNLAIDPLLHFKFAEKVDARGPLECWPWKGATVAAKNSPWYRWGVMRAFGKTHKASRVSWMLNRWPIPKGQNVLHLCDNPLCVNPGHLFLGSQAENIRDMDNKHRRVNGPPRPGERHHNHKLTTENVVAIRESSQPASALARAFGVSAEQIRNIKSYRQRRHG